MHQIVVLLILFSLLITIIPSANGDIKTITISSDSRRTILFKDFCFDLTGHVSLTVSNVSIAATSTAPVNTSRIGFYFGDLYAIPYYGYVLLFQEGEKKCILEDRGPKHFQSIATFAELSPKSSVSKTLPIPAFTVNNVTRPVRSPDHLGIFFSNCEPNTSVSMHVRLETYNLDRNGKNYLEVGMTQLPMIYSIFAIVYLPLMAFWFHQFYKNRAFISKIHVLMSILIIMKSLNLFFEAEEKHYIKVTGTAHGWDICYYLVYCVRALLLITVCLLIGIGWTIVKPTLNAKDKKILAVGLTMQVFSSIGYVYTDAVGTTSRIFLYLALSLFLVHFVGFMIVFPPIYASLKAIKEALKSGDGTAVRDLQRMRNLDYFLGVVISYLLVKTLLYLFVQSLTDDDCGVEWIKVSVEETLTLGLYGGIFYLFQPREQNDYFLVQDEETALATIHSEYSMF